MPLVMEADGIRRALVRIAHEIVERNRGVDDVALVGIRRRGVPIAQRLAASLLEITGRDVPTGALDITLYRDDLMALGPRPVVGETMLPPGGVERMAVVLVDDVLYTGRTVRAALNELMDWGRPARILLCVLVDRGDRELPIQPDVVGRETPVLARRRVDVLVPRLDGRLEVAISAAEAR